MDKKEAFRIAKKYVEVVVQEFNPKQIVLFGSYNDGTPHEWSDIDIAVIYDKYPGPGTWWDGAARLTSLCRKVNAVIEPHLMELDDDPWGFAHKVQKTGKVLYSKI
ncbi:MAG: nucleotidyltransferase domain-containing protein [Chitinispirillales bacterium]|jgi:predicted nucleotidyltransferase|nr:nucleotidyltransferase domain-containing protein [Chitinispirillales bacterium]